ncbi:helix-turn-helix transcriptional regulator [Bdellovibrio sp. NC01]|uniref:helix-turn-helix domain-containing protein n=1 Tax=Bdellovibrio sp. NC01 TaxID=2220073 RepID=UPI00143D1651|nr:helix-turn-helix transcriptional regulator [Bdellovibrio sp. NC01]
MSSELIEIDPNELRALLRTRGLSRYDLAKKLDISTKTVQRWLNESVRRIRLETLERLAGALEVNPEQLKKSATPIANHKTNKTLDQLCSFEFFKKVRTNGDWENYLDILKTFNPQALSSEQRLDLYKHIGICSYYLRKFKACRLYLKRADEIADALNRPVEKLLIYKWQAAREHNLGNFAEAQNHLLRAEELLSHTDDMSIHAWYFYYKAQFLHQEGHYEASLAFGKQALLLEYTMEEAPNMLHISLQYFQVGCTHLRLGNYLKAKIMFQRMLRCAEKAGWVRGVSFGHFYLAVVYKLAGRSHLVHRHFGKARVFHHFVKERRHDPHVAQIEFLYQISNARFEESKKNILQRLKKARNSRLHFAYTVIDALFLQKLCPDLLTIRQSYLDMTEEFFTKNNIKPGLELLKTLSQKTHMTEHEVFQLYHF